MEIIKDPNEKEKIIEKLKWKKLRVKRIFAMNNPWAKDKHGQPDTVNLALYLEFIDKNGETYLWLPTEKEIFDLKVTYNSVKSYNLTYNSGGREWWFKKSKENNQT
jgi:hypothetical protein